MLKKEKSFISIAIITVVLTSCQKGNTNTDSGSTDSLKKLAATEVKEYRGKDLSSIIDFHENSIKGPQYIDINSYILKIDGLVENTKEYTYNQVLEKDIILVYKMNDVVLPPEHGFPFQLVAEDKLGYKWAKWITEIELSDDSPYKGYWWHVLLLM